MNVYPLPRIATLIPALAAIALSIVASPSARAEKTWDIVVTGGEPIYYTDPENRVFAISSWHRLLAFHTFLREQLKVPDGADLQTADVGCVSNECARFEPIEVSNAPGAVAPYDPPAKVTYRFFDSKKKDIEKLVSKGKDQIDKTPSLAGSSFSVSVPTESPGDKTCIPPYQPPCYDRPVCTLYAGCSRSSSSCVKCVK